MNEDTKVKYILGNDFRTFFFFFCSSEKTSFCQERLVPLSGSLAVSLGRPVWFECMGWWGGWGKRELGARTCWSQPQGIVANNNKKM